jgi:CRISPR-associated protein Csd1
MAFKLLGSAEPIGANVSVNYGNEISDENLGRCLVTGEMGPIAILNGGISLMGASPMGAKLVGFQKSSGYDSYHKEQGLNAPISEQANYAYTTALNSMLSKGSKNHFYFSGDTLVFWASKNNHFEDEFAFFLCIAPKRQS